MKHRGQIRPVSAAIALLFLLTSCGQGAKPANTYEQIPDPLSSTQDPAAVGGTDQFAEGTKIVVIDPGHGYSDGGTVPPTDFGLNITESSVVLKMSLLVRDDLQAKGIAVAMTRVTDYDEKQKEKTFALKLDDRVDFANSLDAALFVSIHIDAFEDSSAPNGYGIHYNDNSDDLSAKSATFAGKLADGFSAATGITDVTIWPEKPKDSYYVTRKTNMPAVLFESGFITNKEDALRLADDEWLKKAAQGIADGIESYLNEA